MIRHFRTIDAHVGGASVRLVLDGFPTPKGATLAEKQAWVKRRADRHRAALLLEPRGHANLTGALLTDPVVPGSDAGLIFMHASGYSPLCGHGLAGAVAIAVERGMLEPDADGVVVVDTLAGTLRVHVDGGPSDPHETAAAGRGSRRAAGKPRSSGIRIRLEGPPSFVLQAGVTVTALGRPIRLDVAYGGEFFAIADAEAAGVPLDGSRIDDLRRAGRAVVTAAASACEAVHPRHPELRGIAGAVLVGPPNHDGPDLRNVTVFEDGAVDRSACGTGTFAVMAVLDAMGALATDRGFVHEGLIGTTLSGRVVGRGEVGGRPAILPELDAEVWITGDHEFVVDEEDPLPRGILI